MKSVNWTIALLAVMTSLFTCGLSFAEEELTGKTYPLTLEDAIDLAIENSQDIKNIEANTVSLNDSIRSGLQTRNQLRLAIENYEDFKDMWYEDDADKDFDHLKDMTTEELTAALGSRVRVLTVYEYYKANLGDEEEDEKANWTEKEIKFMTYLMIFGNEEPSLTDEDLYEKYEKNALLAEIQTQAVVDKTLNNIDLIKGNLRTGVTTLYMSYFDLDMAIYLGESEIQLRKTLHEDMVSMLGEGTVAQMTVDIDALEIEIKELEIKKLEYQQEQLEASLKKVLGLNLRDKLILNRSNVEDRVFDEISIDDEIEMAQEANVDLKSSRLDLDVKQQTYDLYMKFSGRTFGKEYDSLTDDLEYYGNRVRDLKAKIESSVRYGYADVLTKIQAYNNQEKVLENAKETYKNVKASFELGMITQSTLNQAELNHNVAWKGLQKSKRDLEKAKLKYDVLVENGILYE